MKYLINKLNITKKEWYFILGAALIMIIITTLPYLYAYFSASPDKVYNGLHMLTPGDIHVYFSYLEQVNQGNYLFKNLFTGEFQTITTFNIFWLTTGLLGKIFNLGHILTFQLARILLIPIGITSVYLLISYFFNSKLTRKITLVFLLFSSGVGALASVFLPSYISSESLLYWPMDLWVPEYNLFLTLYHSPHLIASLTLIILIFLFFLLALDENKTRYSILAGLGGLLLIQFHPFHLPTIWIVPAAYVLIKSLQKKKIDWPAIKHLLILGILTLPSVLYYVWLMKIDWMIALKAFQNACYIPAFLTVIISYGGLIFVPITALILYLIHLKNKKHKLQNTNHTPINNKFLFLIIWATTQFGLIFMPFRFQRRLTEGLQIPLVFLTIISLLWLKKILQPKISKIGLDKLIFNKYFLTIIFLLGFTLSNWFIIGENVKLFNNNYDLFYFDKQQLTSYQWIKNTINENEVILSSIPNGNFIPGVAGRQVYIGHVNVETLYFDTKLAKMEWFFKNNKNDTKKIEFLKKNNIQYVYYSKFEKKLGNFRPSEKNYLKPIFSNDFTTIYQFK